MTKEEIHKSKWWTRMIDIHGSEEAVRDFMRSSGNKATRTGKGSFYKNPQLAKEIGDKGRETQRRMRENAKANKEPNQKG